MKLALSMLITIAYKIILRNFNTPWSLKMSFFKDAIYDEISSILENNTWDVIKFASGF